MAIRKTKPTTPGRRFATYPIREELSGAKEPHKPLTEGAKSTAGATRAAA